MKIAVIAVDLTGALDTGVQFSNWGFNVQVTDNPTSSSADVVVVNTDSRNIDPEKAYKRVYDIALKASGFDIIYKKIDSTMRGNVGTEIQAVLDATGEKTAFLTPCYPPTARSVKDGHLLVEGNPIDQTEYAVEHLSRHSYIPEIIGPQLTHSVIHVKDLKSRPGVLVVDSETEADLLKTARIVHGHRILVGSAGLAAAVAESLVNPPPVIAVIGSKRTATQIQTKQLVRRLNAKLIPIDVESALNQKRQAAVLTSAADALKKGQDVVISSAPDKETVEKTFEAAEALGISPDVLEVRITNALAQTAKTLIEQHTLSGVVLSGGATAMAVCDALSVEEISIIEELRPGIPLLKLDEINAVTKAGGFGELDALIQATQYLKRKHR